MASRRGRFQPRPGFQRQQEEAITGVPLAMIKQARKSGVLNLSNRSLITVPDSVWNINTEDPSKGSSLSMDEVDDRWWEQVDLVKLILASNQLTEISSKISILGALVTLDLHDNQLTSIPASLGDLQQLQRLNISHNQLSEIPAEVCQLHQLLFLHVEHNNLRSLPPGLSDLMHMEDLDVSNNHLTQLPDDIGGLKKLKAFNASNNELTNIPWTIGSLKGVRTLDLTNNKLQALPSEVGYMSSLEQLYLRHNQLTELPELQSPNSLKELHLGNNRIQSLSAEFLKSIPSISVLDVRDNKISSLPEEITVLQNLQRLDLTNNDLSSLPYKLGTLANLKSLILEGNPLRSIRRDIINRGTMGLLKYLRSRIEEPTEAGDSQNGHSTSASDPSSAIGAITTVSGKTLVYNDKKATSIPVDLWESAKEKEVTSVNFSKNLLTQVPENLLLLSRSVIEINLGFNKLTSVSADLQMMTKLTVLDLRNNALSTLPQELATLERIRELMISSNQFSEIPKVVYSWINLENLMASNNHIGEINIAELQKLTKLATLDLENNDIKQVPPELGKMESLRSVQLSGNAFRNPRPAILAKGTPALLAYLRDKIPT